ncbi:MAG: CHAT domain-containing protein [Erythrobacteraceae bacterium]|nr:CHAT domain-containing protein [Erythrobacteraceae bacterium]
MQVNTCAYILLTLLTATSEVYAQNIVDGDPVSPELVARAPVRSSGATHGPLDLSGASCRLDREEPSPGWMGDAVQSGILCANERAGLVVRVSDQSQSADQRSHDPLSVDQVTEFLLANQRSICGDAVDLSWGGLQLRAIKCRSVDDSWPMIALISDDAAGLQIAYGMPAAFPYLAHVIGADVSSVSRQDAASLVAGLWPTPVPLASVADRRRIKDSWSAARKASVKLDFATAQEQLDAALEVQTRLFGDADFTTTALLLDLAMVLAYQEDFEASQAIIRRAGPLIDQSPRAADRARLAGYQASIAALQGDHVVASEFAKNATDKWRQITGSDDQQALLSLFQADENQATDAQPELALSLAREAAILLKVNDPVSAYAKVSEALFVLNSSRVKPPIWRSEILGVLGEASSAMGRASAAEAFFEKAISLRRSLQGDGAGMVRLLLAKGRAYQREEMNANAIISFRQAIKIAKELPRGSVAVRVDELIPFAKAVLAEAEAMSSEDDKLGLMTELYDAFQIAFVPGRDEVIDLASLQMADADPQLAKLVSNLKQSILAQSELQGKVAIEREKPAAERDDKLFELLTKRLEDQTIQSARLRDLLKKNHPEYQRFGESRAPDLNLLRSALKHDEALASFLIGRDASFLQLVMRDRIYITPIAAGEEDLSRIVRGLRKGLEIEGGSVNEFNLEDSHLLYQTLFGAVSEPLSRVKRLIVVPNGPLSTLPFGTLLTGFPTSDDYRDAPWLVKRMAITHAPSVVSFVNLRSTRPAKAPGKPFLGIANPRFSGPAPALPADAAPSCNPEGIALHSRFDSLEQLPDTIDEVRSVIASLRVDGADLFSDRSAKEEVFRNGSLNQYNLIYVATHAVMPGEVACQREPGIALARPSEIASSRATDGFLDASEVAALQISANLVVLSACNTATGSNSTVQKGDALSGLAESFFVAGARSLLVTHWQVPSAATASLMRDMFSAIGADRMLATDTALQRAQGLAIDNADTAHPFFWGAFSFVGSGTETVFVNEAVS